MDSENLNFFSNIAGNPSGPPAVLVPKLINWFFNITICEYYVVGVYFHLDLERISGHFGSFYQDLVY